MRREDPGAGLPKLSRLRGLVRRSTTRGPRPRRIVRRVMQANRSTGTQPELAVELLLRKSGIRFRRHAVDVPGTPDFVIQRSKVAIFVDGDFWHGYRFAQWKHQLSVYWQVKIDRNRNRDRRTFSTLRRRGWKVVRIWEHQLAQPNTVVARIHAVARTKHHL